MELVPKSHKNPAMSYLEAFKSFNRRIQIKMNPGDILLFHSAMMHRGLFKKSVDNRRLIQLFDCIEESKYDEIAPRILHMPCKDTCNKKVSYFNRLISKLHLIEVFNFLLYFNVACGYGIHDVNVSKVIPKKYHILASEANQRRHKPTYQGFESGNVYVILKPTHDLKSNYNTLLRAYTHYSYNFFHFIILVCMLVFIYKYSILSRIKNGLFSFIR
jgi:hypothetical protein